LTHLLLHANDYSTLPMEVTVLCDLSTIYCTT